MLSLLTINDIITALILAAFFTWLINRIAEFVLIRKTPDFEQVLKKCYDLFPQEILQFRGEVYCRGMSIRLITTGNKTLEGEFLGLSDNDMVCIMTRGFIIAQALRNIERIEMI